MSLISAHKNASEEADKRRDSEKKREEEEEKVAEKERNAAAVRLKQERLRKLALTGKRQQELITQHVTGPREMRLQEAKACDEEGLAANANTIAGFGFGNESAKTPALDKCPKPLACVIDTFGDSRNASNKNPEWPVALQHAFETGECNLVVLVVEPQQLSIIMADKGLHSFSIGDPCAVGASFDSLRMLRTTGGGILGDGLPWSPSEATDGGLLQCYLIPVHKSAGCRNAFNAEMRKDHLPQFAERSLPCGDGSEVIPTGCGGGPFLHVAPHSITVEMASWVERGFHADPESSDTGKKRELRGLETEPFPLSLVIAAFLGFRKPVLSPNQEGDPQHVWLSAGDPKRLAALYEATLRTNLLPFVFIAPSDKPVYKVLILELELLSYFFSPKVAEYFHAPQMLPFTHHRLLSLMAHACAVQPEVKPIEFLNTHSRSFSLRKVVKGMQGMYQTPSFRSQTFKGLHAQTAAY